MKIPLTQGKEATVCDCHYEEVSRYKWMYHSGGYAYRQYRSSGRVIAVMMHGLIASTPSGMDTDHIDRNKLNNQCNNLEVVSHQENMRRALGKTACHRGHMLIDSNLYIHSDGGRECKECKRMRSTYLWRSAWND